MPACIYNTSLNCQHFHSLSINSSFAACCPRELQKKGLHRQHQGRDPCRDGQGLIFPGRGCTRDPPLPKTSLAWCLYPCRPPSLGQAQAAHSCSHSTTELPSQETICTSLLPPAQLLRPRQASVQGTRLGLLKTCLHSALVWADAVCALCTQATCTGMTKRSLSNVRWLNLPAERVSSHLLSSVHLGLMKASIS